MDSNQQEPPGVCWMSRRQRQRRKRRALWPQRQALCAGWNASRRDHWPQKTILIDHGNREVSGTMGASYSSPLDTATFLMASHMSPWLGCFQTSNQAGLGAEKLCKIPYILEATAMYLSDVGMGVCGGHRNLLFHHQLDWHLLCPDHITLCFSCTYITTSWTDLLTTDRWHWFLLSLLSQDFASGNELFSQPSRPVGMPKRKYRPRKIFIRSVRRLES